MNPPFAPSMVEVDRILRHPMNPNELSSEEMEKVRRDILATGNYPRLIVRTLERSQRLAAEHREGKVELLDGEHRLEILEAAEYEEVACDVWVGITDYRADLYLAQLNHRGKDNMTMRAALIRSLHSEYTREKLLETLPDTDAQIKRMMEVTDRALDRARGERAAPQLDSVALTVFCSKVHYTAIRNAMKAWRETNDPQKKLPQWEGKALAALVSGV